MKIEDFKNWRRGKRENWNVNVKLYFTIIYIHLWRLRWRLRWDGPSSTQFAVYLLISILVFAIIFLHAITHEWNDQGTACESIDTKYSTLLSHADCLFTVPSNNEGSWNCWGRTNFPICVVVKRDWEMKSELPSTWMVFISQLNLFNKSMNCHHRGNRLMVYDYIFINILMASF